MITRAIRFLRDFHYADLRFLYVACLATIAIVYTGFRISEYVMNHREKSVLRALQMIDLQRDRVAELERQDVAPHPTPDDGKLEHAYKEVVTNHPLVLAAAQILYQDCLPRACGTLFTFKFEPPSPQFRPMGITPAYHAALNDGLELAIKVIREKNQMTSTFGMVSYVFLLVLLLVQAIYIFRPAIQRLNASLSIRSDFLSRISHEIRNPMNSILGMADILRSTQLNYEQQHYVDNLIRSGHALLDMLNNLIDFSSIERGKLKLNDGRFDLFASIDRCIGLITIPAHHKNLNVYLCLEPQIANILIGDSVRLEQVLINLLNNAVKFTEHGYIRLRVTVEDDQPNEIQLHFSVEDSGIGIRQEQLGEIFESFVQADSSIQRRYGGSGLGLSISSELIRLMGGKLEVNSEVGAGSTFFFTVRLKKGATEMPLNRLAHEHFAFLAAAAELPAYRQVFKTANAPCDFYSAAADLSVALQSPGSGITHILIDDSIGIISMINSRNLAEQYGLAEQTVALIRANFTKENMDLLRRNGFARFMIKPLRPWALLDIPAVSPVAANDESHSSHTGLLGKLREKNLRILLVDDSNDNLFLLKEVVQPLASTIHFAENGLEAIEQFNSNIYDVVFMDIQMPVMDGYTAIRKMRAMERPGHQIPIYAVTAHASLVDAQKCREAGFTDRIVKPVLRGEVYRQLSKAFHLELGSLQEPEALPKRYLERLLPTYLKTRQEDMVKLHAALSAADYKTIGQIGHKIKGSAASYGFNRVSELSQMLETAAQRQDLKQCQELVSLLDDSFRGENKIGAEQ